MHSLGGFSWRSFGSFVGPVERQHLLQKHLVGSTYLVLADLVHISKLAITTVLIALSLLWLNTYWEWLEGGRASFSRLQRFQSTVLLSFCIQIMDKAGHHVEEEAAYPMPGRKQKTEGWAQDTLRVHPSCFHQLGPISSFLELITLSSRNQAFSPGDCGDIAYLNNQHHNKYFINWIGGYMLTLKKLWKML